MSVTVLAVAGVALIAAGGLLAVLPGRPRAGLGVQAAGMSALGVVGLVVLIGGHPIGATFSSSISLAFGLDGLSGFFLAVLAITAVPALVFARDYLVGIDPAKARWIAAATAAFLLALVGVLAAREIVSFLASWELMTLIPAAAILIGRRDRTVRSAVYAYLAITHLGGAGVWVALLALAAHGAVGDPAALAAAGAARRRWSRWRRWSGSGPRRG